MRESQLHNVYEYLWRHVEDVMADTATAINVWVVHRRDKLHIWGLKWIPAFQRDHVIFATSEVAS